MRLLLAIGVLAGIWALTCAWVYFRQESLIFHPSTLPDTHRFQFALPFEEYRLVVEPGVALNALLFPAAGATTSGVVLYLHGNGGDLRSWGHHADLYVEAGHDFLAVDYRGYGKSDGRIESEEQLHADIQAVWEWLAAAYEPERVTVVGYSLGSALAARVACANGAGRLVLLAPFFSGRDVARRSSPWLPPWLVRYQFRTDQRLADCDLPVTLVHGDRDATVSSAHSDRLLDLLGGRGRLVLLPGVGHQDIAESRLFRDTVRDMLGAAGS